MISIQSIPRQVQACLFLLEANGYSAWLVGGAIRDLLIDHTSDDWDIATSATPADMLNVFRAYHVIPIGAKHGTVRVIFPDIEVDMTTYRVDGAYHDGRRPATVSFSTSIHDDLSRRDFTINALAYHPERGLLDPFFGLSDLRAGIIRAVGEPEARLKEDYLRIMRALRFAATLGFRLERALEKALMSLAPLLTNLPLERLGLEWTKLLAAPHAASIIARYFDALTYSLPSSPFAKPYLAWRSIEKNKTDLSLRYVSFSLAMDLPDRWFDALLLEKKDRQLGKTLRRLYHSDLTPDNEHAAWRWLGANVGLDTLNAYFRLRLYMIDAQEPWLNLLMALDAWRQDDLRTRKDLAVSGGDLAGAGVPKEKIGEALERLFKAVVRAQVKNEQSALLHLAQVWYNR